MKIYFDSSAPGNLKSSFLIKKFKTSGNLQISINNLKI